MLGGRGVGNYYWNFTVRHLNGDVLVLYFTYLAVGKNGENGKIAAV